MSTSREEICQRTAAKLRARIPTLAATHALIGLDGFVDEIISVVDTRHDNEHYESIRTIAELGRKIQNAAGESSNYELVVKQMKIGGNGPIMANALASLGMNVTYVGNLGYPNLHPVFEEFARRAKVHSVGEPGHTDALEFEDGKVMLGKLTPLNEIDWEHIESRLGRGGLRDLIEGSEFIGMVNWTMLPHMSQIWARLLDEVLPQLGRRARTVFIDLADPEKRTPADLREALGLLTRFQEHVHVVLGLNLKEAVSVATVLDLPSGPDPEAALAEIAALIRARLDLGCVVIHPRRGAAAATVDQSATFPGPFVQQPLISTGAGDHFNAGFCAGRTLDFDLEESLSLGVAASGYYVRSAHSPSAEQLVEFLAELPPPQA